MTISRIELGPVPLDSLDIDAFLETIRARIARRQPSQIVTLNALMFNLALRDPSLAEIITEAALVVPDSAGIAWAARYLKGVAVTRLPGIDLIHHLCRDAAKRGGRVFFLGAAPGIADAAAARLAGRYPGLHITGTHHGYFSPDEEPSVLKRIRESRPDILLVALAVPRQETWIARNLPGLGVPVVMGVGGSFDVISGRLKRAPRWVQQGGLEWLFRTAQQPWRITRILDLPAFVMHVLKLKSESKSKRKSKAG